MVSGVARIRLQGLLRFHGSLLDFAVFRLLCFIGTYCRVFRYANDLWLNRNVLSCLSECRRIGECFWAWLKSLEGVPSEPSSP